jgi:hypothetical protein
VKLYHGTTEKAWKEIQTEGVLWGRKNKFWMGNLMSRATWLAVKREHAGIYEDKGLTNAVCVILEIEFPDKYIHKDCWQIVIYDPIPISYITRIKYERSNSKREGINNGQTQSKHKPSRRITIETIPGF